MCEKCGKRFKPNNNKQIYCEECSEYQPMGIKTIKCIDCGVNVNIEAKDNNTTRCKECYTIFRKKTLNENSKKYYYTNQILDLAKLEKISRSNRDKIINELVTKYNIKYTKAEEIYNSEKFDDFKKSLEEYNVNLCKSISNTFKKFIQNNFK